MNRMSVSGWPRLFHSMRASRQTELQREFPLHVVCSWLGNSPRIAQQSYLLVTELPCKSRSHARNHSCRETEKRGRQFDCQCWQPVPPCLHGQEAGGFHSHLEARQQPNACSVQERTRPRQAERTIWVGLTANLLASPPQPRELYGSSFRSHG